MASEFVSILMLTHNAPDYVRTSIDTLRDRTEDVRYEVVVVDNASGPETVELLKEMRSRGGVNRLVLSPVNTLFAAGNNLAADAASRSATHYLLLNSDVEVRDPQWLRALLDAHQSPGITSYGVVDHPPLRVDGYCLLIDAASYRERGGLDEGFQWWWAVTKLQAGMLADGLRVQGYRSHDAKLIHFGGKSGDAFRSAKGMNVPKEEVMGWFNGREPTVLDERWQRQLYRGVRRRLQGVRPRSRSASIAINATAAGRGGATIRDAKREA